MGKGHPLRVLAGLLLGDPPPFVRIELDDRGRLAARLPETAQQCRENAPLQGWDEQQSTGDVGQKPGNEQQNSGEQGEKPGNPRIERACVHAGAQPGSRGAPGATDHGRSGEGGRQHDAQGREHSDLGRNGEKYRQFRDREDQKAGEDPTDVEHRCNSLNSLGPRLARTAGSSKLARPRKSAGRRSAGAGPGTAQPCAYIISTEFASKSATKPRAPADPGTAAESKANDVFDIYTIIFLALAVFIFLRLRSVLGQRTGRERPPYDPYSARDAVRTSPSEKVVTLPGRAAQPAPAATPAGDGAERWKGIAEPGSPAAAGLDAIIAVDSSFDAQHFLAGARAAYEMIVTAFAQGDRRTLKGLLSREVYEGFEAAIRERESRGETIETRFISIDKADIAAAELRGRVAQVTVRFVSQLISVTRDRSGAVIEGSPDKVTDVTDVWTFARDLSSRDPNWKLVATEAGQ